MPSEVGDHQDAVALDSISGDIVLENVSFAYDQSDNVVLKDINLRIRAGETVGLVGPTGSGKSTLAALICRFYDPTEGRITLDGKDLKDIRLASLRNRIGVVLQETFLFAGSIRENIAYADPQTDHVSIVAAAKAANAHRFIMEFPDAYDTEVGQHGTGLSGGEKQRIAIARAVLKDPELLVLDEATSAVDTATEAMIQSALDALIEGRTTIAIAHRLSTLRNADKLVVLDEGRIVEQGTHDELLEKNGVYAHLHQIQTEFADGSFDADSALDNLMQAQADSGK
jgi:ABC-type multidrug transport system fused ATPase/permease subunit